MTRIDNTPISLPNNMADAEMYQRLFVLPMVQAVETKLEHMLQPVIDKTAALASRVDAHDAALSGLAGNQKKALVGWGVFATGAAGGMSYVWSWVKGHFHFT